MKSAFLRHVAALALGAAALSAHANRGEHPEEPCVERFLHRFGRQRPCGFGRGFSPRGLGCGFSPSSFGCGLFPGGFRGSFASSRFRRGLLACCLFGASCGFGLATRFGFRTLPRESLLFGAPLRIERFCALARFFLPLQLRAQPLFFFACLLLRETLLLPSAFFRKPALLFSALLRS